MAKLKIEKGTQVELVADSSGHRQTLGKVLTIKGKQNGYYLTEEIPNVYFLAADLKEFACTQESMEKEIAKLNEEIKALQVKIDYLKETGETKFCPKQFKAYQTLKLLADAEGLTLIEKARRVAELYN
jgi:hypothetical protein